MKDKKRMSIKLILSVLVIAVIIISIYYNEYKLNTEYDAKSIQKDLKITTYIDEGGSTHVQGEYIVTPRFRRYIESIKSFFKGD